MQDFRNLAVWRHAHQLALAIYREASGFPDSERFGLTNQMRRSAASIPTNIAEGCGRSSDADFARFLHMALGSASELEYQILLAAGLGRLLPATAGSLIGQVQAIKKMSSSLVRRTRAPRSKNGPPTADS
ncbi:four helix bundle protein [Geothrix fermentans]|uniref:four helix bundle protein n=1 Tax=Geothrix fermentans TaxID=44676 RepID=UPI0009FDEF5B|nr:four helix bundle protein [Geothrix fermentans]